jgi:hypothetical protein
VREQRAALSHHAEVSAHRDSECAVEMPTAATTRATHHARPV